MFRRKKHIQTVMGHKIDRPRMTRWGILYILLYAGMPSFVFLLLLDILFYFIFRYGFGSCYGIFCYF
tara:strand:+ start:2725 stop:2925 length:201 start_codon:yes stop_codon:yes gene_type:complete